MRGEAAGAVLRLLTLGSFVQHCHAAIFTWCVGLIGPHDTGLGVLQFYARLLWCEIPSANHSALAPHIQRTFCCHLDILRSA